MIPALKGFKTRPEIRLPLLKRIDGNTTRYEQKVLATLTYTRQPKRVLEIGTFNGLSTLTITQNTQGKIITTDIEQELLGKTKLPVVMQRHTYNDARYIKKEVIGEYFKGRAEAERITQVLCDSARLRTQLTGKFDFIFVDGSHSYEYTKNDSALALQFIDANGIILWHDYGKSCWPGVKKALDELAAQGAALQRIPRTSFVVLYN